MKTIKIDFSKKHWLILVILIGGFLRFYKLDWGEGLFFHPDEYHVAAAVSRISFPYKMNPELFSYGSFTVYINYFLILLLENIKSDLVIHPIIIGRWLSAFFSTTTILIVYLIAREMFKEKLFPLLAAFIVALTPGLVQQAHFATPESILTFWLFITLYFWIGWVKKGKYYLLLLSALTLGTAIGTKIVALTFLPLFVFLHFKHLNFKRLINLALRFSLLLASLSALFVSYLVVFPYSLLDKEGFLNSMRYETGVGRGNPIVFYTRQFIDTPPILFQLEKILPFAIGPLLILGIIGLFIAIIKIFEQIFSKKQKFDFVLLIVLIAFFSYFIPNGILFAKWTRFVSPSFVFFALFTCYLILKTRNVIRGTNIKLFLAGLSFFFTFQIIWLSMFFSIYLRPDVRITASDWIDKNLPKNQFILTESGNMLEVPLKGNYKKRAFEFYHLEENPLLPTELFELLEQADYFIVQSRRIFTNHQRLTQRYPLTSRFYTLLFSGELGFSEIKNINSFPSINLLGLRIIVDDENAEETWSVFDHPVIRIYKKSMQLSRDDYEKLLKI